jgi:rfaE bifunctional protein kinase chain/domain/rfaE bifunctional protein nucleotidyltransferase chain/domain
MTYPTYARKIKTVEELADAIGPRPRDKAVIMCHGVFDIVHPGHLRHLMYAKSKADLLVASLTADEHIAKANHRPYVPQELRAANLAALEMVDYVIVDPNATPIENIKRLQPDYFAKGYEYTASGFPPRTQEEIATVQSYGGEMLFTPGDVVYSSSALIEAIPPRIHVEKLLALMESEGIDFRDLRSASRAMAGLSVHVVGDTIVDSYSYCSLLGATAKSPTFSVKHDFTDVFAGGAAIVAKHMKAAGARVTFSTILGDDERRQFVLDDLAAAGVECRPYVDRTRPTTHKERFIADGHKMLQVDRVDNRPISDTALNTLISSLRGHQSDVVIFSDFRHGIFSRRTIDELKQAIPEGALKVADSQVSNRWGNILDFTDFDLLTPNEREARFALGDQDSVVRPLASELYRQAGCRYLILKLGERGIIGYRSGGHLPREFFTVDTFVEHLVDPIGAGDALLAHAALALRATDNIVIAAILGSIAAAVTCERQGNVPVVPTEVGEKIDQLERQATYG